MKHCALNVRKAIIITAMDDLIVGRKSYKVVPGTFDIVQIVNSNKNPKSWMLQRRIAEKKIISINNKYDGHIKAVLTTQDQNQPVEFRLIVSQAYINNEFDKLSISQKDNTEMDFSRDIEYFQFDQVLFEQEEKDYETTDAVIDDVSNPVSEINDLSLQSDIDNMNMTPQFIDYLYNNGSKKLTRDNFEKEARKFVIRSQELDNKEIIEQIKCL